MPSPRVCVLRAPGTNCDVETAFAFDTCGAESERLHLFRLLEQPDLLNRFQVLCLPGGFSYGDDIGAGVIFSSQLRSRLSESLHEFLQGDRLVLGICNGFQVLLKSGILPGGAETWPPAADAERSVTLTWNDNGRYTARWVNLVVESQRNVFLNGIRQLELPIAHAEGRLVVSDDDIIDSWADHNQVAMRYGIRTNGENATERSEAPQYFPLNPNGSVADIAGLSDPSGRVLGLMPHPERFIHATQHPQWTRLGLKGHGAGLQIFRNAVDYFK